MYELPTARKSLVIFNRYDNVDPELGMILEPVSLLWSLNSFGLYTVVFCVVMGLWILSII
jgi:hypothetical protein